MWIPILTVCKLAGILITGIAGIVSQLSEEHRGTFRKWVLQLAVKLYTDNEERAQAIASKVSNTINKEACVGWAIVGVVIALASQSVESLKAYHDDQVSRKRTDNQLQTAQQSLDYLERLSTRFDSIAIEMQFELDRDSKVFSALYDFADHFLDPINATNSFAPVPTAEGRVGFSAKTNSSGKWLGYAYTEFPATFYNVGVNSNAFVKVTIFFLEHGKEINYRPAEENDLQLLCEHFSTNAINARALQFIQKPVFDLGFSTVKTKSVDFSVENVTNTIMPIFLTYDKTRKTLFVDYSITCPKTNWNQNKWMTSLPDFAGATFIISAGDVPDAGLRPVRGNLSIDNMISVPLTNFVRILTFPNSSQFSCVLPDKQQILESK